MSFGDGQEDVLKYEILKDGTVKLTSDPISAPNHANAEELFRTVAQLSGGEVTSERRTDMAHDHSHGHEHSHGEGHSHKH